MHIMAHFMRQHHSGAMKKMAVKQNKKSTSRRGNHRSHDSLTNPPVAVEATTGEVHLRHHISATGFYRGKKVVANKESTEK